MIRVLCCVLLMSGCGEEPPAPAPPPVQVQEEPTVAPYDAATFKAVFAEGAQDQFITAEGGRGTLIPEHVAEFLGQPIEAEATFQAVTRTAIADQSVFVIRQDGGSGPADHIVAVDASGAMQSMTSAAFGQKAWLEAGVLRIQTATFPEGSQTAELSQAYHDLDPAKGYVLRAEP